MPLTDWDEPRLTAWLVERVADACALDPTEIDVHSPVDDFGLSSRDAVGLSGELEQLLGVELSATLLWENPTIAGLVRALLPKQEPAPVRNRRRRASDGPIAVVGIGCRFPGRIDSPDAFWRALIEGTDVVGEVPADRWSDFGAQDGIEALPRHGGYLEDIAGFDAEFFGITPREARLMDPQQRMVLEVAWEALEHAGIAPDSLAGTATGVFVGMSSLDYAQLTASRADSVEAWSATGASASIAANRLSYALDLRGPSVVVDTACSSSLVAVHQACQALRAGEITTALVGGSNALLSPTSMASMAALGVLAPDGRCKPFDAAADGITRAEGCGMVVLKRLTDAERDGDRVLALIRASAVNSDGRSNGLTAPNPEAQQTLLAGAYRAADLEPSEIDYVEAHGTGTLLGDPIEARALGAVLGAGRAPERPLLIGSVKSNLGHLEAAAGVAGLIKVVLALRADQLPASLHYRTPNPHIAFAQARLRVVDEPAPWPRYGSVARAGVSAFGFGGTNAHVVVEEAPRPVAPAEPDSPVLATVEAVEPAATVALVSASSPERLRASAARIAEWAATAGELEPGDVAHTLARRYGSGRERAAVVGSSLDELAVGMRRIADGLVGPGIFGGSARPTPVRAVWLFSGYGSQWAGMGQDLLRSHEVFAAAVDELTLPFVEHAGISLRKILETEHMVRLETTQLGIFGIQVCLAQLWRHYGLEPAAVIGSSMGEVAAAVASGGLSTEDGVRVMALRARLLGALDDGAGAMASVQLSPGELDGMVRDGLDGLEVAVYNAPDQLAVAGCPDTVDLLVERVLRRELSARLLPLQVACHTAAVEPMLPGLAAGLADLPAGTPVTTYYNSIDDDPRATPVFDAAHWVAGARRPVRFAQAVGAAVEDGHTTFLEVAPHPVVLGAVRRTAAAQGRRVCAVASMRNDTGASAALHQALAALHCAGDAVDWSRVSATGRVVSVPAAPWRHRRHWVESAAVSAQPLDAGAASALLGVHMELPGGQAHGWQGEWSPTLAGGDRRAARCEQLVLAAGRRALGTDSVEVVELTLREPAAEPASVTTLATAGGEVEVQTRSADGVWSMLATARVRRVDGATASAPVGALSAVSPAATTVPAAGHPVPAAGHPVAGDEVTARVLAIISSVTGYLPEQVPGDVPLLDLGLDSLMAVRIRNGLAAEFGVVPEVREMQRGLTVDGIVERLRAGIREGAEETVAAAAVTVDGPDGGAAPDSGDVVVSRVVTPPRAIGPRDAAERMMVRLWAEELGVCPDSVTAHFVTLGGGREHATRLAARLSHELGHDVSADELLARPVLHEMAAAVRRYVEADTSSGPVRVLRAGGSAGGPPVHFFHPAGGPTSVYRPLVDRLPEGTACYGLERDLEGSVPTRVAGLLRALRATQPTGPYRLAGWSFGGMLAFEAARQLRVAGAEVEAVYLIDTVRPRPPEDTDPVAFCARRLSLLVRHIEGTYGRTVRLDHEALASMDEARQVDVVMAALGDAQLGMSEAVLHHQRTSIVDAQAGERYEPGHFDGRVVLYRATRVYQGITDLDPRYARPEPDGGWADHCGDLEIVRVEGDHLSVIDPPHVDAIAADLCARLGRVAVPGGRGH